MILFRCYYAEHRCELYRVREDDAGVLVAERCEPTADTNAARAYRPSGGREEERLLATLAVWPLSLADMERVSGVTREVAEDWVRDHL